MTDTTARGGHGRPRRALLSVSDKQNITEIGRALVTAGFELISTGGTMAALTGAGLPVTAVEEVTGFPEMMDGRVKTLHPAVHAGILARPGHAGDREALRRHGMAPIDVVVVNLYPFEAALRGGAGGLDLLEQIDIGGPALIRAAAKNWPRVTVVVDPADYGRVAAALQEGGPDEAERRRLAAAAFAHTAYYDAMVAGAWSSGPCFPEKIVVPLARVSSLRYGENPHQQAAIYRDTSPCAAGDPGLIGAEQIQGKELSFNNFQDAEAAWRMAAAFTEPTAAVVKHTIPCGVASAATLAEAFERARDADPVSIFGGVVAVNQTVDEATAALLAEIRLDLLIAPGISDAARPLLARRKNLRILAVDPGRRRSGAEKEMTAGSGSSIGLAGYDVRRLRGGLLLQDEDRAAVSPDDWQVVTRKAPPDEAYADLVFAWRLVRFVKSNAIVIARRGQSVGIGAGQTSRVAAVHLAVEQAGSQARDAVLASDAFFPFPDGVEAAIAAGVTTIIQPGGSVRDQEVTAVCDRHGIAMVMTGVRHFLH
ncbi:MAG: bifunctional phosphoribosylaminoimidazolecarboxamide formyltransferase/IMP cyclohydrolase [Thermaerobacterales bacterium]